jgi:glycosyltransferase involved in cell wall biosynthesis
MADYWASRGRAVRVITLSTPDTDFYRLHSAVERIALGLVKPSRGTLEGILSNVRRALALRAALEQSPPDVVIGYGDCTNVLALLAGIGKRWNVIAAEHSDPRHLFPGRAWDSLRRMLYPRAAAVVALTNEVANWLRAFVDGSRVHVIPNFVRPPRAHARAVRRSGPRQALAVGRFTAEKRFDLLVDAFSRCAPRHSDWSLTIAGDGPMHADIEERVARLGLRDRVRLPGVVRNVHQLMAESDLFVLSSRFEGFGMVLVEAMATGLPCLATDCDSGPRHIVRAGETGVLVPPEDVDALAHEMDRLMTDAGERERLASRAPEVLTRFGIDEVMQRWDLLVADVSRRVR